MRRRAFTLMEIVLAIALMSVVMYLLTTAIEMFMIRIESSRGRVESAQVARTLLDRMAADLIAARLYAPPSSAGGQSGGGGQSSGGQAGGSQAGGGDAGISGGAGNYKVKQQGDGWFIAGPTGGSSESQPAASGATGGASSASAADDPLTQSDVQGIYGTIDQLRIDRTATANWERASRQVEPEEGTASGDMPTTVRYYVVEGDRLTSQGLAQRGVPEDDRPSTSVAGLYRSTRPTASLGEGDDPLDESADADLDTELLAPEVVKLEFQYFDGTTLKDAWDAYDAGGLPAGVEIRLALYEPRLESDAEDAADRVSSGRLRENELVEYRRFVRIPSISPQQPADALLPAADAGQSGQQQGGAQGDDGSGGQQGGQGGGQGGTGQGGGGNPGGGQGSGQN